mgnify:CR=1 FL=1
MGLIVIDKIIMFFLCLMIFFLPISKAVIEVSAIICILGWAIKRIIILAGDYEDAFKRAGKFFTGDFSMNQSIFLFIAANLMAVVFSSNPTLSVNTFFLKLIEYILIFIIVADTVNTKKRFNLVIGVLLVSLLFIGLDGFFQVIAKHDLFRHRKLFQSRVTASFINPNDLGSYLITLAPLVLSMIFVNFNKKLKALLLIFAMIVLSVLMLTNSKGAWFAFLGALLFLSFYIKKRYVLYILLVLFIIGLILPAVFNFSSINLVKRMVSFSGDAGAIDRKFLWLAALRMFYAKPLFGVGLGTFMENYQRFWIRPTTEIAYAHNCYLQTLAETGIIGLLAFMLFLCVWFAKTIQILSRPYKSEDAFVYFSFLGLTVGLLAYLLNSFVDTNLYSLTIAVLFWFILGLQQAGTRLISDEREH